jgi:hypothetical protein
MSVNMFHITFFYPEDGGSIFLLNIGKYSIGFKASYSLKLPPREL